MKFDEYDGLSYYESTTKLLSEHETAPTWSFGYGNYRVDPSPNILVLGSYTHPNTGNKLVGGINLNYLSPAQKTQLRRMLPRLMNAKDLYHRYHLGLRILPGIFDNFYRTYNPGFIRSLKQNVLIPRKSQKKTANDLIKHRLDKVRKSREQIKQEYMPRYPGDLNRLQRAVSRTTDDILDRPEDEQTIDSQSDERAAIQSKAIERELENEPEDVSIPQLQADLKQDQNSTYAIPRPEDEEEIDISDVSSEIEDEEKEAAEDLEESIIYYDPRYRKYIIEPAFSFTQVNVPNYAR